MILPKILPGAEHLIAYHVVTEGRCFANIVGGEPIAVEAGEVIVFTNGDPHVMSSSPGMRADAVTPGAIDAATTSQLPFFVNYGGDGPAAKLVCGFLACDARRASFPTSTSSFTYCFQSARSTGTGLPF